MATELFSQNDGTYRVRSYVEVNRHGNPQYRIRFGFRSGEVRTITARSEEDAAVKATQLWQAYTSGGLGNFAALGNVEDLVDEFVKRPGLSPATVRSYRQAIGVFVDHVGKERDLTTITRKVVEAWLASMTCKPVSKASYLRSLSALFKWAKRETHVEVDPTAEVRVVKPRGGHTLRPWMQSFEWPAFLAACGKVHRVRAEFVLHTGLRAGELVAAQWSWLRGSGDKWTLTVPASKSARHRAIPLDTRAVSLLAECRALWGEDGYLFGKDPPPKNNLRRDTVRACQNAKVTVCDFHGLRRSCGANWIESGVEMFVVSRWLGHQDVSTTARHYVGLSDAASLSAVAKVNAAMAVPPPVGGKVIPFPGSAAAG